MSSSLPDGFHIRAGRPDDVKAVTELIVAEEQALRGQSRWTESQTRDWFHGLAGDGELRIVERDARPAGVLGVYTGTICRSWLALDPSSRDERIGQALVAVARQIAEERKARKLQIGAFAENRAVIALLEAAGFHSDRHFYTMQIELNDEPPAPRWPEGVTCTTAERTPARAYYDATLDAFAEDDDFHPLPFEEWRRRQFEAPDFDPSLWFAERGGSEIAGIARCWPERWGCGWVDVLGVRKPWRRRGLGLALLRHAFRVFYERGRSCVGLEVDAANPTGATRLYERAGMQVVAHDLAFAKELA
jgi:ribosomal protein S18 acetylase RimI-like enzyme